MKSVTHRRLSDDDVEILAPTNLKILSFKTHLDGPRIWFEINKEDGTETYFVKRKQLKGKNGLSYEIIKTGRNPLESYKVSFPKNATILGIMFDSETWDPILFLLLPAKSKEEIVEHNFLLVEDGNDIPSEYFYHSTSLKPNWGAYHLYCKK